MGKSRERLKARLREKLPDRQQCGAMERQEGLDISNLLIFFPSGGLRLMRKSQNYSELDAFRTTSREDAEERQSLMVDMCLRVPGARSRPVQVTHPGSQCWHVVPRALGLFVL